MSHLGGIPHQKNNGLRVAVPPLQGETEARERLRKRDTNRVP